MAKFTYKRKGKKYRPYKRLKRFQRKSNKYGQQIGKLWRAVYRASELKREIGYLEAKKYGEIGQFVPCTIIAQGTGRDQRDGQDIHVRSVSIFGQFNMPTGVDTYQFYMALIRVNSSYVPSLQYSEAGADITAVDLSKSLIWDYELDSLTTPNLKYNWIRIRRKDTVKEFNIVWQKWFRFNKYERNILKIAKKIFINKKVTYKDSDTTGVDGQGQLYWFFQSDKTIANAGDCYFHIMTKYTG